MKKSLPTYLTYLFTKILRSKCIYKKMGMYGLLFLFSLHSFHLYSYDFSIDRNNNPSFGILNNSGFEPCNFKEHYTSVGINSNYVRYASFPEDSSLYDESIQSDSLLYEDKQSGRYKLEEEVVVVGYGTQKKSDVTGSVASVAQSNLVANSPANVTQGLRGKVAGVNVYENSGEPGGQTRVTIRGLSSINSSNKPLWVVDGVVMEDVSFLNPGSVKSIEVLKDASSSSIYGSRGANGVILVTTDRGGRKGYSSIKYSNTTSLGYLRKKQQLLNSQEFTDLVVLGYQNANKFKSKDNNASFNFPGYDPRLFKDGKPIYNTDWQDAVTRLAISSQNQLSFQMGTDKTSTGFYASYSKNEGILLNTWLNRFDTKLTWDAELKQWLSVGANIAYGNQEMNEVNKEPNFNGEHRVLRSMIEIPSIFPVKYPDGSYASGSSYTKGFSLQTEDFPNPVNALLNEENITEKNQIFGNVFLQFTILKELKFKTQFGIDRSNSVFKYFAPSSIQQFGSPSGRTYKKYNDRNYWQFENFLTYDKKVDHHKINFILGLSWQKQSEEKTFSGTARQLVSPELKYNSLQSAELTTPASSYLASWAMNSYFTRASYSYDSKYLATITARYDGSSRFGSSNKYGLFPSLGLGWVLSNESFMDKISWITNLKLKTSYGVTGNTEFLPYQTLSLLNSRQSVLNSKPTVITNISSLSNSDLKWERTSQFDVGMELELWERIKIDVDYYYKLTTDLIMNKPLPYESGFPYVVDNIGAISNKGVELMVNTKNIAGKNFSWNTTFVLNYNRNIVEKLGSNDEDIFPGPDWFFGSMTVLRKGESVSSFWVYPYNGVYTTKDEADAKLKNPDTVVRSGDFRPVGNKQVIGGKGIPDFVGSLVNSFDYKNWSLVLDIQFVQGVEIFQGAVLTTKNRFGYANGIKDLYTKSWTEQNQTNDFNQIRHAPISYPANQTLPTTDWIVDGSYVRGNLLKLVYSFDKELIKRINVNDLKLGLSISNFFVLHSKRFFGYDPEASSFFTAEDGMTSSFGQNIFFHQYPKPTTVSLSLNVNF